MNRYNIYIYTGNKVTDETQNLREIYVKMMKRSPHSKKAVKTVRNKRGVMYI